MFTLGIPDSQQRRANDVLSHDLSTPIDYNTIDQGDGFHMFTFDLDYDGFQDIVLLLKKNGVTTIGADDQLTERNIMKLTNLIKEQPESKKDPNYVNKMETAEDIIEKVDEIITDNPDTALDLLSDMVEDFYENQSIDRPDTSIQEQKLRKYIRNIIKSKNEK